MKTQKQKETIKYTINDIDVWVTIDYFHNKIDIVKPVDNYQGRDSYEVKKYIFKNRGVEYLNGWCNILEATKQAIQDAKGRYKEWKEEQDKIQAEEVEEGVKVMQDVKVKKTYDCINEYIDLSKNKYK